MLFLIVSHRNALQYDSTFFRVPYFHVSNSALFST